MQIIDAKYTIATEDGHNYGGVDEMNASRARKTAVHMVLDTRRHPSFGLYRIAMADVEACWQRRTATLGYERCRIEPGGEFMLGKRHRFERFAEEPRRRIRAPWVLFVPYEHGLTLKVLSGNHRIAVLRDGGAEYINVQTDAKSFQNAKVSGLDIKPIGE